MKHASTASQQTSVAERGESTAERKASVVEREETLSSRAAKNADGVMLPFVPPHIPRGHVVLTWFINNPLIIPAIGLMAGIFIDNAVAVPMWLAILLMIVAGVMVVYGKQHVVRGDRSVSAASLRYISLCLAGLATGAVLYDTAFRCWPSHHIVRCCAADEAVETRVRGTIINAPVIRKNPDDFVSDAQTRFVFAAELVESDAGFVSASGLINVTVNAPVLSLRAGQPIQLLGRLRRPEPARNPGSPDFALIARRNGILVNMSCSRADDVLLLPDSALPLASTWRGFLGRLRNRARVSMLADALEGDVIGSGLLATMVLGQRSEISPALNDAFIRSGTVHYLSVSGAHVGMLVAAVFWIGSLTGASRRGCALGAIIAATSYAILVEPSAPMIRAAILTNFGCLAMMVRRRVSTANWLAASLIFLLMVQPTQLFDVGFQLSFTTLASIIYLYPCVYAASEYGLSWLLRREDPLLSFEMQRKIHMQSAHSRWGGWMQSAGICLAMSISAWAVGSLLSAYYFQQLQVWGWLNTIILMPIIWLVMVVGLAKVVLAGIVPAASYMLGWPLAKSTQVLIRVVEMMAAVPGAGICTPQIPVWLVVFGLLVALAWTLQRALRLSIHAVLLPGFAFVIALLGSIAPRPANSTLDIYVLAVGNGSVTLIELPNGRNLLYDFGTSRPYDIEKWSLGPLLARDHCSRIDAVLLSHADSDHYSGLFALLDRRRVDAVISMPYFEQDAQRNGLSRRLMEVIHGQVKRWRTVAQGDRLAGTGDVAIEVLWPPRDLKTDEKSKPLNSGGGGRRKTADSVGAIDSNDTSMVLRISYAGKRLLLCGDVEDAALQNLLATVDVRADVLMLPHHGNVTHMTSTFVRAVNPRVCVCSRGRPVTDALKSSVESRPLLSTFENGAIKVRIRPQEEL